MSDSGAAGEDDGDGGTLGSWGPPVLLVDDLTVLLSLGVSVGSVLDFSHYCFVTVCSKLKVGLSLAHSLCLCLSICLLVSIPLSVSVIRLCCPCIAVTGL